MNDEEIKLNDESEEVEEVSTDNEEKKTVRKRRKKGDADGKVNNEKFLTSIGQIEKESLLPSETILELLKQAIRKAYLNYIYPGLFSRENTLANNELINAEVTFERNYKEIKIYDIKQVVETDDDIIDDAYQICLEEAKQYSKKAKVGETVRIPFPFVELPTQVAKMSKIYFNNLLNEASKKAVLNVYSSQINGLIEGTVTEVDDNGGLKVSFGKASGYLKRNQLLPSDRYSINDKILVYLSKVSDKPSSTSLEISRATPLFVEKLLERAVPELEEGIIKIEAIAREPGKRTKMFVSSSNPNIDPIGTCVGPESSRIRSVLNELKGETIDILKYHENKALQIIEAMKPAVVTGLTCEEDFFDKNVHYSELEQEKDYEYPKVTVVVMNSNSGVAIGANGVNVKLATKLSKCMLSVLETDKAIEENVPYKTVSEIEQIIQDLYPDEKLSNINTTITSSEEEIDDDNEDEEQITAVEADDIESFASKEKAELEEKKAQEASEEHIEIKNKPRVSLSQLENTLSKKKVTKKSYKKKTTKKDEESEEEVYKPVENAMPIYTDEELQNLEQEEYDEDENSYDDEDFSEYDSDEYYKD